MSNVLLVPEGGNLAKLADHKLPIGQHAPSGIFFFFFGTWKEHRVLKRGTRKMHLKETSTLLKKHWAKLENTTVHYTHTDQFALQKTVEQQPCKLTVKVLRWQKPILLVQDNEKSTDQRISTTLLQNTIILSSTEKEWVLSLSKKIQLQELSCDLSMNEPENTSSTNASVSTQHAERFQKLLFIIKFSILCFSSTLSFFLLTFVC